MKYVVILCLKMILVKHLKHHTTSYPSLPFPQHYTVESLSWKIQQKGDEFPITPDKYAQIPIFKARTAHMANIRGRVNIRVRILQISHKGTWM